jgi:hypothetical protein
MCARYAGVRCFIERSAPARCRFVAAALLQDDRDKVFIQQVFYGCMRQKQCLKVTLALGVMRLCAVSSSCAGGQVFLSSFYFNNASSTNRGDFNFYMVLAYVALFRLEEMGIARFRFLLNGLDTLKTHMLRSFMFNRDNMETWCKEEWCKCLDRKFVEVRRTLGVRSCLRKHIVQRARAAGHDHCRDRSAHTTSETVA